ncbi:type IV pilus assembly protein PilQ [Syntrophus gentianae]|uniref:Type IV pilus assembly protein PilQ n=1 Tax=Syntrophus gentianae TaxID=43775 RepID=A0A1H7UF66_9BACT|nr:secretin and TonB N-terminal domain-containing protein [Syntrophus gentianae]SEL95394.1 type IV pilus assembly protein PilQ [Syntrophus gentianae]
MKIIRQLCGIVLWVSVLWIFPGYVAVENAAAETPVTANDVAGKKAADIGNLENITLDRVKGKERVTFIATKISSFKVEEEPGNSVLLKLENLHVPEILLRPFYDDSMINIQQVVAEQKTIKEVPWVYATVNLEKEVPYSVRQEGQNVVLDFNVATLGDTETFSMLKKVAQGKPASPAPENLKKREAAVDQEKGKNATKSEPGAVRYSGQKISLDFQDADMRAVLRLLAETGGVSIVAGPDVKGSVSIHMRDVPWDQALETILDIYGMAKKEMGNVISVMTLDKKKKDEEVRKQAEKDQIEAELTRKARETQLMSEKGKLRQISIEAKIVEASDEFVRNLGVTWGGAFNARIGNYSSQTAWGTNTSSTEGQTNPVSYSYPNGIGYSGSQAAVNLPGALAGTPTLGFVIGGANAVLEAQIAALETTSSGKIISTPKVTTMDGVKATIKQGEEIPYMTYESSGGSSYPKVSFKDALLKLEVTPTITPDGRISMLINATNDRGDYSRASELNGNVPIVKNEVDSKVVVENGTTVVIGGVSKTTDDRAMSGVPWLNKIPVLGWLFKSESIDKTRKQLLIFVTPKIIHDKDTASVANASVFNNQ